MDDLAIDTLMQEVHKMVNQITLSQSLVKQINKDTFCGQKFKLVHLDRTHREEETEAQTKGRLFEYLVTGSLGKDKTVPVMKKLKSGHKSTEELRIEKQALRCKQMLEDEGIEVLEIDATYSAQFNEDILVEGTVDILGEKDGERIVIDLKLTGNVYSTWGEFGWGNYMNFPLTQPIMYMRILDTHYPEFKHRFQYWVFDYTPDENYKIIEIQSTGLRILENTQEIHRAGEKLMKFRRDGFEPVPSFLECKGCPVLECPVRVKVKPVEIF